MGFADYDGPVRITFPAPGVMMVSPVESSPDVSAGQPGESPHPYLYGPGQGCATCGELPGADVHDPAKEGGPDVV